MAPDVSRRPGFVPSPVCVGLLVDRVALRQFLLLYFGFALSLSITPQCRTIVFTYALLNRTYKRPTPQYISRYSTVLEISGSIGLDSTVAVRLKHLATDRHLDWIGQ
jgi:hypothetical protein